MLSKFFSARFWFPYLVLAALFLVAVLGVLAPHQLPVVLYKGALVLLAALVGHVISVGFCPYARLTSYLVEDWRKNPDADGGSDVTIRLWRATRACSPRRWCIERLPSERWCWPSAWGCSHAHFERMA